MGYSYVMSETTSGNESKGIFYVRLSPAMVADVDAYVTARGKDDSGGGDDLGKMSRSAGMRELLAKGIAKWKSDRGRKR